MNSLSKYLEDISFIGWVFEPTTELDLHWQKFLANHPEEEINIQYARKIVLQFRTVTKCLSEEEKILLFSRVLKQIDNKLKSGNSKRIFIGLVKYAAVAFLFFSIGVLLFHRPLNVNPVFQAFNSDQQILDNQAQLILSNGENVVLAEKRSRISYQKSGKLVINNDTIKPTNLNSNNSQTLNQLIIPYGKTSEIILPDGTKVFLNAGSRLAYPDRFTGNCRTVMLLGEALFDVKQDPKHPFIVQVNDLRVKDLGTRFNVSAYPADGRVEIVLVEGKVSIKKNNADFFTSETELEPGQLASFDQQTNHIIVKSVDVDDYILWTQGIMKFESADLNRITKKLERYYHIRFHFDDPLLVELKISGKLELSEDLTEVLERIARTASINIEKKGDDFYEVTK